jgi:hypothetical protein
VRAGRVTLGAAEPDLTALRIHFGFPGLVSMGGPPPIPAKKPFVFRDMRFGLRRSSLILRELGCRYLCTKELRVFLDENETTLGREPLTLSLYLRLCANGGINLQTIFGDSREGDYGWLGFEVSRPKAVVSDQGSAGSKSAGRRALVRREKADC